ncbi:MAG: LamG domain-containing protein, partial [Bacteroidetes bacterium]|nr:LamG domain-containing protein [Bacteroidota bacterium]
SIPFGVTEAPETPEPPTVHRSPSILQTNIIKPSLEVDWNDPLNKGLVAWYPFKQKGGNVLRDVAGDNDGTLESSMTSDDWVVSPETGAMALNFDGTDDEANIGNLTQVDFQGATFAVWHQIYVYDSTIRALIGSDVDPSSATNGFWLGSRGDPTASFEANVAVGPGNQRITVGNVYDTSVEGIWYQTVLVVPSDDYPSVYVNGSIVWAGSSGDKGNIVLSGNDATIGAIQGAYFQKAGSSDLRIYDRALSPNEVNDLYQASRTGYVNQYKRRSFSIAATPTMLERIRSRSKPVAAKTITIKHNETPSYKAGYAKSAGESAYPSLWDGLKGAWMPQMGITGIDRVIDVTGRNDGDLVAVDSGDLHQTYLHVDADGGGKYGEYLRADQGPMTLPFTLTSRMRLTDPTKGTRAFSAYKIGSNSGRDYHQISVGTTGALSIISRDQTDYDADNSAGGLFAVGEWINVTAVWTEGRHDAYLNGQHVAGGSVSAGLTADTILVGTGRLNYASAAGTGDYATVLYHDRELTLGEIAQLHADPLAPFRRKTLTIVQQPTKDLRGLIRIS